VTSHTRVCVATTVGAVAGGVAGYLLFTDRGRAWRQQLEPALDEAIRDLGRFRDTVLRVAGAAGQGWRLLDEAMRETRASWSGYSHPYQTSPF
jgi:hypothetical protein